MKKSLSQQFAKLAMLALVSSALLFSCQNPFAGKLADSPSADQSRAAGADFRAPSQSPPGGLTPAQVPQFVILGFDDNQYADGMTNILNVYKGKSNPAGSGNPLTFDGTPAAASFYVVPSGKDAATGHGSGDGGGETGKEKPQSKDRS